MAATQEEKNIVIQNIVKNRIRPGKTKAKSTIGLAKANVLLALKNMDPLKVVASGKAKTKDVITFRTWILEGARRQPNADELKAIRLFLEDEDIKKAENM